MTRPLVMGVLNVTPDSFSDGGRFAGAEAAIAHGLALIEDGADLIDIGGESTRPGAAPVTEAEEIARVIPVIQRLTGKGAALSIDTMKPAVARAAMTAGALVWNDVFALQADGALDAAAEMGCQVILMHMQGEPGTMQKAPHYDDVVTEVTAFLEARAHAAMAAGVDQENIWIDPGIGFGKTLDHNLALLANIDVVASLGFPVVLGVSRKRFIQAIDPGARDAGDRLGGSIAAALAGIGGGASVLRVHDVRETVQALQVLAAISAAANPSDL